MLTIYTPNEEGQVGRTEMLIKGSKIPVKVQRLAKAKRMRLVQENAQRMFGPSIEFHPLWAPPKGSEIFVGRVPKEMDERHLVPIFEQSGQIFQLRLMMNFSGANRGYCFVQYFHPGQADLAIKNLHGFEIRRGHRLVAVRSVDNCRLLLGGMPTYKTEKEIYLELSYFTGGVERVWKDWLEPTHRDKGIVLVAFISHRAAALARSEMLSTNFKPWGYKITVDWAEPEPGNEPFLNWPQVLRVENIPYRVGPRTLTKIFNQASYNGVTKVIKRNSIAYIYFFSRCQAEAAKVTMQVYNMGGRNITVRWGDPNMIYGRAGRNRNACRELVPYEFENEQNALPCPCVYCAPRLKSNRKGKRKQKKPHRPIKATLAKTEYSPSEAMTSEVALIPISSFRSCLTFITANEISAIFRASAIACAGFNYINRVKTIQMHPRLLAALTN